MTALTETATWESTITQLETSDLVLGGSDGASNRALKQLANRTSYLLARLNALTEMPLAALPYPTIDTADHRLTVTPAAATAGGTVSIAAGTRVTLAEVVESAETGRLHAFETAAYTSADLVASSTYYLRAQVDGSGDLLLYTQRGADSDTIPASMVGTPDATSGGGFDSTVVDMLLAKVVTGSAGSTPTVTTLANARQLRNSDVVEMLDAAGGVATPGWYTLASRTLNWARTPTSAFVVLGGFSDNAIGWTANGTDTVSSAAVKLTSATRYSLSGQWAAWEDATTSSVSLRVQWFAEA